MRLRYILLIGLVLGLSIGFTANYLSQRSERPIKAQNVSQCPEWQHDLSKAGCQ